ncbi:DUF6893 family small protein [Saccharopolyspora montiporae]
MRKVGIITTLLAVAGLCTAVLVAFNSTPDIKRYLRIRRM